MEPTNQIFLLVICGYLCFTMADALHCVLCISKEPGAPCLPPIECSGEARSYVCHALKTYKDGVLQQKILGCEHKEDAMCGRVEGTKGVGIHTEHVCCGDRFYCNKDL